MTPLLLLCGLLAAGPLQGAPNRFRVYPNAQIHVLSIAGDDKGIVWLGAADGLYRFDGQRFQRISGFPIRKVKHLAVDDQGTVWAGGAEGLVRYRERAELLVRDPVTSLSGRPFVLAATTRDVWRPLPSGELHRVFGGMQKGFLIRDDQAWFVCGNRACWLDFSKWREGSYDVPLHRDMEAGADAEQVVLDSDGFLWVANGNVATAYLDQSFMTGYARRSYRELERQPLLMMGQSGQLWILDEPVRATPDKLKFYRSESDRRFVPTASWEDRRGHVWVAYKGEGLREWTPDMGWRRWSRDQHFGLSNTTQVTRSHAGKLIAVTQDQIFQLDPEASDFFPLPAEPRRYDYLHPTPDGGFIAAARPEGLLRLGPDGRVLQEIPNEYGFSSFFRTMASDAAGRIWVGNRYFLGLLTGAPGRLALTRSHLVWPQADSELVNPDFQMDSEKRLWVGHAGGLSVLKEGLRWESVETDPPIATIRTFAVGKDEIWVGYRRPGKFSRLRREEDVWRVTDFQAGQGYTPEETRFLRVDSRGWIWRGTPEGVMISDGRNTGPDDWLHLQESNGLDLMDMSQYGFFEDRDGSVWLAAAEGVVHLQPKPEWFDAPAEAPVLSRFEIAQNAAFAEVSTIGASPFRPKPLRYRLLPAMSDWRLSTDGALSFNELKVGEYTLEVAYHGNGEPPVLRRSFPIAPPAVSGIWRWGALLAGLGLLAGLSGRVRYWIAKWRYRWTRRLHGERDEYGLVAGEILRERYRILGRVSEGGFSMVYEAEDLLQKRSRVALKVVIPMPGQPNWIRERFAFEVATLQSIEHPGVVAVVDSWVDPRGWPCLVMPLLEGPTLRAAIADRPLDATRAARLIRQMGAALGAIHERGVVHRDVKPDNVVLSQTPQGEQAVLIDFGSAGFRAVDGELATTRLIAASLRYAAPERLTGHYSTASDVYSLAVTILEILSLQHAMELGEAPGTEPLEQAVASALQRGLPETVSRSVAELLARGFAPDTRHRPAKVELWCEAIAEALTATDQPSTSEQNRNLHEP